MADTYPGAVNMNLPTNAVGSAFLRTEPFFFLSMVMLPWSVWLQGDTGIHFPRHSVTLCFLTAINPAISLEMELADE